MIAAGRGGEGEVAVDRGKGWGGLNEEDSVAAKLDDFLGSGRGFFSKSNSMRGRDDAGNK